MLCQSVRYCPTNRKSFFTLILTIDNQLIQSNFFQLFTYARVFFDETLLTHIKLGNNDVILSMLEDVKQYHQLADKSGTTLLHFAARYDNTKLAQHLINRGATVDSQNRNRETPLMYALDYQQENAVKLLLKAGADIFLPNFQNCALGMILKNTRNFNEDVRIAIFDKVTVKALKASKYVSSKQFHKNCPLHNFISMKNPEITRILLENGSSVDERSSCKQTALHIAAQSLDLENVKVLLEFNADVNARKYNGDTPATSIRDFDDQNKVLTILKVLIAAGATFFDLSFEKMIEWSILKFGNREIVRTVLQCGIVLDYPNEHGLTALHYLAWNKHAGVLEELKDFNYDVNVRCDMKTTLLHSAAYVGNPSSVQFLLDNGVDVNVEDEDGITPLSWAMHRGMHSDSCDDYQRCIEILLERGAHPQLVDFIDFKNSTSIVDKLMQLARPVIAQLALLEVSGQKIEDSIRMIIDGCEKYKTDFLLKQLQLEMMKRIGIHESVSLLEFLTTREEKMSVYARNTVLVMNLTYVMNKMEFEECYHRKLQKRFLKVTRLAEMRKKVTVAVSAILSELYGMSVYNVAKNIVDYIDDQDLNNMYDE